MIGRAKTPEQKKQILQRIYAAWLTYPQLRLGQLLHNVMDESGQPLFYIEDEPLAKACEDAARRGFKQEG